jgi:hypothetical protein
MLKMQRFELSSNDTTKLLTQELLLIVRQTSYNPISQQTQEKGEKVIFIKDKPLSCAFHLISMMTILLTSTWNAFLDCVSLVNSCEMLSHTSLWGEPLFRYIYAKKKFYYLSNLQLPKIYLLVML